DAATGEISGGFADALSAHPQPGGSRRSCSASQSVELASGGAGGASLKRRTSLDAAGEGSSGSVHGGGRSDFELWTGHCEGGGVFKRGGYRGGHFHLCRSASHAGVEHFRGRPPSRS